MLPKVVENLRRHLTRPPGRRIRLLVVAAFVLLGFVTLFHVVAPFLISSTLVRNSMEEAVAEWTGHKATIQGSPDIRFWPEPRITLKDITVRKQVDGTERVLGRVSLLSASFDLFDALRGEPNFSDFELFGPEIYVVRSKDGRLDWTNDGLLSRAVRQARADGSGQALREEDDARIGEIEIHNGTFELLDSGSGRVSRLVEINGKLDWPSLSRAMQISAHGELNGRKLSLDMSSTQPLLLLSGKSARASVNVNSDVFQGRFAGTASLATRGFLSGDAELTIPDMDALTDWLGVPFPGADRIKSLSVAAELTTSADVLRFEKLSLALNGAKATGILDLVLPRDRLPRLTGTLAFDRVDLSGALKAITPQSNGDPAPQDQLSRNLELDLRLSAQQATLGPLSLTEAAVSIMNTSDQSRLDIVDSGYQGGHMSGRVAAIKEGIAGGIELRLSVQDVDLAAVAGQLGLHGPVPSARGSVEVSLQVARPLTREAWHNARGNFRLEAQQGTLPGLDFEALRRLATQRPYFSLSEAGGGSLSFDSIQLRANLIAGRAEIQGGRIVTPTGIMTISGIIPYASNSLALSASLQPADGVNEPPLRLFIGGSWPNPVFWPVAALQPVPAQ